MNAFPACQGVPLKKIAQIASPGMPSTPYPRQSIYFFDFRPPSLAPKRGAGFIPRLPPRYNFPSGSGSRLKARKYSRHLSTNPSGDLLLDCHMIVEILRAVLTDFFAPEILHLFCIAAEDAFRFVLFENDAILVHQDLHWSVAPYAHGPAQVFGQYYPAQHVQPSHNPNRLHNLSPSLNFDIIHHYCIILCIVLLEEEDNFWELFLSDDYPCTKASFALSAAGVSLPV
jgi:hypothetical protein